MRGIGVVAQLGERRPCTAEVRGSSPRGSTCRCTLTIEGRLNSPHRDHLLGNMGTRHRFGQSCSEALCQSMASVPFAEEGMQRKPARLVVPAGNEASWVVGRRGESTRMEDRNDGHTVDALALDADEGRGHATKCSGEALAAGDPEISEWGNPAGVMACQPARGGNRGN